MQKFEALKTMVNDPQFSLQVEKFNKGNQAAGTRVRKYLADIKRACQAMRNEVQDIRMERKTMKPE